MKKLLLTSSAAKTLHFLKRLTNKKWRNLDVVFINTAGNPYDETPWIEESKNAFYEKEVSLKELDIANLASKKLKEEIGEPDVIFVAGGNTLYLLEKAQESGFMNLVPKLVEKGTIYIGSSAGSILAGPDLSLEVYSDDRENAKPLNSYQGLNFVNFLIQPHWSEESSKDEYLKIAPKLIESKTPLITLTNKQAILVKERKMEIVVS